MIPFHVSEMALKTISSFPLKPNYHYGGSVAKLRLYYDTSLVDNEQRKIVGTPVGSAGFYDEIDITLASLVPTIATFSLVTTEDSDHPNAKVTGVLYDSTGARRDTLFEWSVPSNDLLASPATFAQMDAYNQRNTLINPPSFYQTQTQVVQLFNSLLAALGIGPATNLVQGLVLLSIAAADPANPKVWGFNDPLVRDALKLMGVALDASVGTPADGNVLGFSLADNAYKPLSGATPSLHAVSHQNGGGDEVSVAGLSGLLADPQTPLGHAASHQNGGADEISIAGLSGLLADPQTPLAHKTSHQSGGSDAIKLDDLATPDDNTDLNASPTAHGLLPKLSNNATQFLNGQGAFTTPAGGGDVSGPAASVDGEIVLFDATTGKLIKRASNSGVIIATSGVIGATALSGVATQFLNGTGAFSVPAGGGGTFADIDVLGTAW